MKLARLSSAQPTAVPAIGTDAIAAVVLGGTNTGGKGRIVGTLIGALIASASPIMVLNLLVFTPVPDDRQSGGDFAGGTGRQQKAAWRNDWDI